MPRCTTRLIYVEYTTWCAFEKDDEWKTTFKTYYNHFKYVVMSFDLTNTLAIFQHLMHDVFHEYLDDFMVYYIDDIFILSKNMEDHEHRVQP